VTSHESARLRIVHVFRAPVGGLFRHVLDVARAQIARGHDVGLFCDAVVGGPQATEILENLRPSLSLGLVRVPMSRFPDKSDLRAFAAVRRHVIDVAPHVVHGHGSKGGAFARLPAFLEETRRPVRVYTPHGGSFNYKPGTMEHRFYMAVERILERRTDVFLFESAYIADRFTTYVGETDRIVRVVHNGIADAEFTPIDHAADAHDLVYVGELRWAKGVDTLLEAVALLARRDARALSLLIVGAGPEEAALKARAAAHDLVGRVTFSSPRPIREALRLGRIMAIPSRAESLPYVILEAAAAAQPLVATHAGGIPEIFGPHARRLIAPGNATVLADAIAGRLDMHPDTRQAEALALSRFVGSRFSLPKMVDDVIGGYRAALGSRILMHEYS